MSDVKDIVPRKPYPFETAPRNVDPFKAAIESMHLGSRYFGAGRGTAHVGIDLFVHIRTPVQVPAEKAVLIGVTRSDSIAGITMGNALVLFVPDEKQPYFLALLHLDRKTFRVLREKNIGDELSAEPGVSRIVAYTGNSASGPIPHLHVTAGTRFQLAGKLYTAQEFMRMYKEKDLTAAFLRPLNPNGRSGVVSIKPPGNGIIKDKKGLLAAGYLDPEELMRKGLRFSTQPPKSREKLAPLR